MTPTQGGQIRFSLFNPKIDNAAFVAGTDDERFRGETWAAFSRAETDVDKAIRFRHLEGGRPRDVNRSGLHTGPPIVSPKFLDALIRYELTGWATFPIELTDRHGDELEGFALLGVTGRCGPIEDRLSEIVMAPPPVKGGRESRKFKGILFDPNTWDGTDLFCASDRGTHTFASEDAVRAFQSKRLTGIDLRFADEVLRLWKADGGLLEQPWD